MPIYEYQCSKCGRKFEILQRWDDAEVKQCKFCKGKVSKLISSTAFHLKGGGWYVTDYADKGKKRASGADEKAPPKEEKEPVTKSEATPDSQKHDDAA